MRKITRMVACVEESILIIEIVSCTYRSPIYSKKKKKQKKNVTFINSHKDTRIAKTFYPTFSPYYLCFCIYKTELIVAVIDEVNGVQLVVRFSNLFSHLSLLILILE